MRKNKALTVIHLLLIIVTLSHVVQIKILSLFILGKMETNRLKQVPCRQFESCII